MSEIIQELLKTKRTVAERVDYELRLAALRTERAKIKEQELKDTTRKRWSEVSALSDLQDAWSRGEIPTEEAEAQARKIYYNR